MSFGELVDRWMDYQLYSRRVTSETERIYRFWLRQFRLFVAAAQLAGRELEADTIELFLQSLARRELADETQRTAYGILHAALSWAHERGLLEQSPMADLRPPIVRDRKRFYPSRDQVLELLDAIERSDRMNKERDLAIVATFYYAGLRISECLGLKPADLNLEHGIVTVLGKGGKIAELPICPRLERIMRRWLRLRERDYTPSQWLFPARARHARAWGGPVERQRIQKMLRTVYGPSAGVLARPHDLRRAFAKRLRRARVPIRTIQLLLRHRRMETTEIYLGDDPEDLRSAVKRL